MVSHNRHFVSQIANKIWYIEDKQIKEYPGTYDEYEYWRKKNEASGSVKQEPPKARPEKKQEQQNKPPSNTSQLKSLEKDLKKVEEYIESLQIQKTKLEADLASTEIYSNAERLRKTQQDFENANLELKIANDQWGEIAGKIDELNGN